MKIYGLSSHVWVHVTYSMTSGNFPVNQTFLYSMIVMIIMVKNWMSIYQNAPLPI